MEFTGNTKVAEIAQASSSARQVLEQAGVDYCCGGGNSLHDACLHAGTSEQEILKLLQQKAQDARPEDKNWQNASLAELTRHIRERHHKYVREAIARVRPLLAKVKAKHGANHPELSQMEQLFADVSREMTMHMQKEEQILFPYIDAMEQAVKAGGDLELPFFQTVKNPIFAMMKEHDAAGDLLKQIRSASADYTAPADACTSYQSLYKELREFEADLHQHVHLENNILFPRAVEMEGAAVHRA